MERSPIIAALGPTNTGKTFRALERLLDHDTGMIGLPLRLLAREVYDKLVSERGERETALITGEEKIIPRAPRYWVCTVEAMPLDRQVDFVAVDEIQLAAHHERGHVFTERLLNARGSKETWFMGSSSMVQLLQRLVPTAKLRSFPRLSRLRCEGTYSLASLPPRSAVVAFSMPRVYEIAERIRAKRGGVAIVLGALSPRARNSQVEMYQAGEVDYLVATDAIGMGLNLKIDRVAFADTRKFDGRHERGLQLGELAQIAGRAGRYQSDGAFGTLSPRPALASEVAAAIEEHNLGSQRSAYFRNHDLDFTDADALQRSLKRAPQIAGLHLLPEATDERVLTLLLSRKKIRERATSEARIRLLWDVCQIPDYRKLLVEEHAHLIGEIFTELLERGKLEHHYLERKILRLRQHSGDIEAIMGRIASIRIWAYVTCRASWVEGQAWHAHTREIDDALSDELHRALVERFVSKKNRGRSPSPPIKKDRSLFSQLAHLQAAQKNEGRPPQQPLTLRLTQAQPSEMSCRPNGGVFFEGTHIATLTAGRRLTEPQLEFHWEAVEERQGSRRAAEANVRAALRLWLELLLPPTLVSQPAPPGQTSGADHDTSLLRGIAYQLRQGLGSVRLQQVRPLVLALSPHTRAGLKAEGIFVGRRHVYRIQCLEPAQLQFRAALVSAQTKKLPPEFDPAARAFSLSQARGRDWSATEIEWLGYEHLGPYAARIDLVEQLLSTDRENKEKPWHQQLMSALGCSADEARFIARQLGIAGTRRRRRRKR